jgi:hypothetical protein
VDNGIKYDDACWHYGGDFPSDLPPEAGATHIGMFAAWAMMNGFAGAIHTDDYPTLLGRLQNRELTPGSWFIEACDEKLTDEDLNDEGNAFAQSYYANEDGLKSDVPNFLDDYTEAFPDFEELYRIPDTWESYEKIAPVISRRFIKWRNSRSGWRRFCPS